MIETRLPRIATALYGLSVIALVLFPVILALAFLFPSLGLVDLSSITDTPREAWPLTTWLGILAGVVPAVFMWLAVNGMRQLFALYRLGDPLAPAAGPLIKSIGSNLLACSLLNIALVPVQSGLVSLTNPVGEREIAVALNSNTLGFLLIAGLLLLIGWSMAEAHKAVAENREFV